MRILSGRAAALDAFRDRGSAQTDPDRRQIVELLLADVRARGDAAVLDATERLDGVRLEALALPQADRAGLAASLPGDLREAIDLSIARVRSFHERQPREGFLSATPEGVLGQLMRPLARVGCYVPSGAASLASSLVMSAVPAQVAGVEEIVVATPPRPDGGVDAAVAYVAEALSLGTIYRMGGAQAVGALAYGTQSVARVDKVVGPGSAWVVIAKALVFGVVGIESLPGPTETLVIADAGADPEHVAADLLAQAEHDGAVPVLVLSDATRWAEVEAALERRLADLPTAATARASLHERGTVVFVDDVAEALDVANAFAPEHLCLLVDEPWSWLGHVRHAGGVFVGASSLEALGDYVAGPSHVMPTGGTARFTSALNVRDFQRVMPVVGLTPAGLRAIGPAAARFARAEGLEAHARAVEARWEVGRACENGDR